jgi:hypothetical protein
MNSRLVVNGYELDLSDNIAVPLNLSITDIKEPEKRKRSFSKTLTLEGTSNNMAFFIAAYSLDININESTNIQFTPNLRYDCEFFKNDLRIFKGKFKLNEVKINNGNYTFDCNLLSDAVDIFAKLKDKKLNELNWSMYDHQLSRNNVISSWFDKVQINGVATRNFGADSFGYQPKSQGYIYPLVDYGYVKPNNDSPLNFRINQLYPFIYVKEAVKKCLDYALEGTNIEVDYTTTFFTNENMKKLIYGFGGGEQIKMGSDTALKAKLELLNGTKTSSTIYGVGSQLKYANGTPVYYVIGSTFNLFKSPISYTTLNQNINVIDLINGELIFNIVGTYNINVSFDLTLSSSGVDYNTSYLTGAFFTPDLTLILDGVNIGKSSFIQTVNTTSTHSFSFDANVKTGQKLNLDFNLAFYLTKSDLTYSISNIDITINADKNIPLTDLSIVSLSTAIPDIKCSEFLKGILNLFYAYMSDPIYDPNTNKSTIYIDSFINYYSSQEEYDNWTDLIDESKDITIQSNSLVEGNIYQYTFSEEKDYLNTKYRDLVGINYGEKQLEIDTWLNGVVKFELPFNTYVPFKIQNSQLIYPMIKEQTIDSNNGTVSKPYKGKGMLTFYNGLRSGTVSILNASVDDTSVRTLYPFTHHIRFKDNQNFEPLFDLHFASRNATFDDIKGVPQLNTFEVYHKKFLNEITSIDSKLVTLYLKLSYKDINELDFAKLKMIDGVLYRLNTIKDFDSDAYGTTEVELIKFLG